MTDPNAPLSRRASREAEPKGRAARAAKPAAPSEKTPEDAAAERTGIAAIVAKHPRAWLAGAIGVVFLLLATAVLFAGAAVGSNTIALPGSTGSPTDGRATPEEIAPAMRLRTCSVASMAADPALAGLSAVVRNATTGEVLFDRQGETAVPQGGPAKVLTAAAALTILGPDATLATRVYEGSTPNTIVLVGGGDPTITTQSGESIYAGAPKLKNLANQVLDKFDDPIENIVLDVSLWSTGDRWDASWSRGLQTGGQMAEVVPLLVDGDRANPTQLVSPRSTDPVGRAGALFAESLGLNPADVTFSLGSAVTSKPVLGEVFSQPVNVLIGQMLMLDDNTLAEQLARLSSKVAGFGGTAASLQQTITSGLGIYAVSTAGVTIHDGSGQSGATIVPPAFMAEFMGEVQGGGNNLNYVFNSLPVAGKSGGLAGRFGGANAGAAGLVTGMPGAIPGESSLVGIITAVDGTQLAFAFYAIGAVGNGTNAALDTLAGASFACGDNLSNN